MTDAAIVNTNLTDSEAGEQLGREVCEQIGDAPDALIVFASPSNDYEALLAALDRTCHPKLMVGCSSSGEFTSDVAGQGLTCAVALRSADMRFTASVGKGLSTSPSSAAAQLAASWGAADADSYAHRCALILVDALAGHVEPLVEELTTLTAGAYRFFGGGAGDNARFEKTHVFVGTKAFTDAVVALEMLSQKPIGIGARHGWVPATAAIRVTEAEAATVVSMNASPPQELFEDHAVASGQSFDPAAPLPFFLHNVLGVAGDDGHKLRVPLGLQQDGSLLCAAEVPAGSTLHIMRASAESSAVAAGDAARDALSQLEGLRPKVVLFFDCVATRLRLGHAFNDELDALRNEIGGARFAGFNTHGQIVRAEGQFSGFHNCTAVVCAIPE